MSSKKWVTSLLSIALVTIILFGFMTYYLDPLLQYGKEPGHLSYRTYTEMYCNPGIAKNYDYDTVLVGSSMVENTDVNEIDNLFNCKTIKVPYSGAFMHNHKKILDICFGHNKNIKKVFFSLDEYSLTTEKDKTRYPLPEYLYDDKYINDLSYLINLDIFYIYTIKDVLGTLKHEKQAMMKSGSWIEDESVYCKKNALESINYPIVKKNDKSKTYLLNKLNDNIEYNVMPIIKNNPDTEFVFYMVPYSILYWYQEKQNGLLDTTFYNIKLTLKRLLQYDNVQIHFFQDEKSIITNLDYYKDYTHFKPKINSWMTKEMKAETHLLTLQNYKKRIDDFKSYLNEYDFDSYYIKQSKE